VGLVVDRMDGLRVGFEVTLPRSDDGNAVLVLTVLGEVDERREGPKVSVVGILFTLV
jgi:hypothetical protein